MDFIKKFKQEIQGEIADSISYSLRDYIEGLSSFAWLQAQKWSKWNDDGPILLPDNTRIYYRKGDTEIVLQEFDPQIRTLKFGGVLVRENKNQSIDSDESKKVQNFSLALPYTNFAFKFTNGTFHSLYCGFSDVPLKTLDEKIKTPFLSNTYPTLNVCLGRHFDDKQLVKDNISQQTALVLDYFWSSVFIDEWASHYWSYLDHFKSLGDKRFASLEAWQTASFDDFLFVIDDVQWIENGRSYGDLITDLLKDEPVHNKVSMAVYDEVTKQFTDDMVSSVMASIDTAINNANRRIEAPTYGVDENA